MSPIPAHPANASFFLRGILAPLSPALQAQCLCNDFRAGERGWGLRFDHKLPPSVAVPKGPSAAVLVCKIYESRLASLIYGIAVQNLQSVGKAWLLLTTGPDLGVTRGGYPRSLPRGQVMDAALSFGNQNFGGIELGDARRTARLVRSADAMCRHPGGTLPDKLPKPADLRAFYRLMDCDRVTHEVLMLGHTDETRRRIAAPVPGVVLTLHDGTELDYTSKKSLEDQLGQIGPGTRRGYICHNSLAVRLVPDPANGTVVPETLGLLSQILHHRPRVAKDESQKAARERVSRESRLWLRGVQACGPAPTLSSALTCRTACPTRSSTWHMK